MTDDWGVVGFVDAETTEDYHQKKWDAIPSISTETGETAEISWGRVVKLSMEFSAR